MSAIYKREFKSYFQSVIGWLFIAATLLFASIYFVAYNMLYCSPYFANTLSSAGFIMIVAIPLLTMRVIAEERKNKTDQLILTAPVSVGKIVLAKYLALATVYMIPMLLLCLYPLVMSFFGTVSYAETYTAILGFVLFGLACLAVGMFISSITDSQVIAVILSLVTLIILYLMSSLASMISAEGNLFTKILTGGFDFYGRFNDMMQGTFAVRSVVYFVSAIALLIFLTTQSIQKRRWSVSSKTIKNGVYSTFLVVAAIALTVIVNLVVNEIPERFLAIDMTSNKLYSLTDDTKNLVKAVEDDITVYVLSSENNADTTVVQTLERYADLNDHIKIVYKNPVKYPNFASDYTTDSISTGSLIVESAKRNKVIPANDLYETQVDYTTYESKTTGYDAEGQLTSAISYVTSDDMPKMYIITGHDEMTLETSFTDAIKKENIETETINLMNCDAVPEDAACIMLLAPVSDYSEDDAKKIQEYLDKGNKAFMLVTYSDKDMSNYEGILKGYGVTICPGLVAEGDSEHFYQNPYYLLPTVESATQTAGVYNSKLVFMPFARGMQIAETEGVSVTPLLSTSEKAYAKAEVSNADSYEKAEGDVDGPFTLGAILEKTNEDDTTTQIALFSSENMFTDSANQMVSGANLAIFSNTLSTLVDHEETVSIPVKSYDSDYLAVPQASFILIAVITVVVLPFGLLIAGILIWLRRRRR